MKRKIFYTKSNNGHSVQRLAASLIVMTKVTMVILMVCAFHQLAPLPHLQEARAAVSDERESKIPHIPDQLARDLSNGLTKEVIILFNDTSGRIEERLTDQPARQRLAQRPARYQQLKEDVFAGLAANNGTLIRDYSHLPMSLATFRGRASIQWLQTRPDIIAVYENKPLYTSLSESLPLIGQPEVAEADLKGAGVSVAVLDTGVNYTAAAFGGCTSPGVPESCKVAVSIDIAANDNQKDAQGHGTNVSGIIVGMASEAKIIMLDIFDGASSSSDLLLDALNWVLANEGTYTIKVVNMSLGDNAPYTSACRFQRDNPFLVAINDLRDHGITVVAASGNNGYTNAINLPACTPGVISVGAVYDSNVGSKSYSACSDATTATDRVACFSNTASFLSILAPGAVINAAGYSASGTSQASPHIAGAAAVLAAIHPDFSPDEIATRLTSTGTAITDTRNNLIFPRLNFSSAMAQEIAEANANSTDVPFLPAWALIILGFSLALLGLKRNLLSR